MRVDKVRRRNVLRAVGASSIGIIGKPMIVSAENNIKELQTGESYVTPFGETITITNEVIKHSFIHNPKVDTSQAYGSQGESYVFAKVETDALEYSSTSLDNYRVFIGNRSYPVNYSVSSVPYHEIERPNLDICPAFMPENRFARKEQRIAGGFGGVIPTLSGERSVGIVYVDNEAVRAKWEFNKKTISKLSTNVDFNIIDINPEISEENNLGIAITVKNTGDSGIFRASVSGPDISHPWSIEKYIDSNTISKISSLMPRVNLNNGEISAQSESDEVQLEVAPVQGRPTNITVKKSGKK